MKNIGIKETLEKYFMYFMMYSVIGWLYEVFLEVVVYGWGFRNRGVLFGPWLPIYGTGALVFILCLRRLKAKRICIGRINITPVLVFFGIMFIATAIELAGSYIMEYTSGDWMWNYERYAFDFEGRIALNPSIRFGLGGMLFMYVLQPLFERIIGKLRPSALDAVAVVTALLVAADVVYTFIIK